MKRIVNLFVLPAGRAPGAPGGPPEPAKEFSVEAPTLDQLREVTRTRLIADGYRVRSISFGPRGLIAYAEERR
ncbi:MAG: hypothetical protein MJE77_12700 [Proteobacteria bacterium]|nr:hypothetical protein [Pseudomonadota bacterium]